MSTPVQPIGADALPPQEAAETVVKFMAALLDAGRKEQAAAGMCAA